MARKTIEDLFIHELSDMHSAKKQVTRALPRMARAATNPLLADAFTSVALLAATLAEEKGADEKLTKIAEQGGNQPQRWRNNRRKTA